MNEQLQKALSQLIEKSMAGVENSLDFLSSEIPDVIYQLLMWYGVQSALNTLMGLALLGLFIPVNKKIVLPFIKILKEETIEKFFTVICFIIIEASYVIYALNSINLTWLKIWIAPKVWLLDYAASIVK